MTRLLTTGWETNDINEVGVAIAGSTVVPSIATSSPTPRSPGAYCYKLLCATTNTIGGRQITLAAGKADLWVRCGVYIHGPTAAGGDMMFLVFNDANGINNGWLVWHGTDQLIRATGATYAIGTSSVAMTPDAWHTLEVRWLITSSTVGTVEVWLDGTRVINATGVDNTRGASLGTTQILQLGNPGIGGSSFAAGGYIAFDDLTINDASGTINNGQIGDGRVVLLKPNGAGSSSAQTRGGTDSGANWSQVDELPPSLTDYVYSATAATRDTYALENIPAGSWSVNCVDVLAYGQNSDAGAGALGLTVKSGATTNEGTAQNLTAAGAYYRQLYETDPATSIAWTTTAVNALEAGTTVR